MKTDDRLRIHGVRVLDDSTAAGICFRNGALYLSYADRRIQPEPLLSD
jgi:hypothetical protein